ncbi:MAG: hypothetical protein JKY50_00120 [Oleispira sp.]|nr:hypothetical protein [Oleispira sp.]
MKHDIEKSKSFIIVDEPEGAIKLEYNKWFAILHLWRIEPFTKDIHRWGINSIGGICDFLKEMGYEHVYMAVPVDNKKINKVVRRLGLTLMSNQDDLNVYRKEL